MVDATIHSTGGIAACLQCIEVNTYSHLQPEIFGHSAVSSMIVTSRVACVQHTPVTTCSTVQSDVSLLTVQSAALGLAIAGALGLGYSNIFVTAPSPENLRTLFEFIFKGLDQLAYKEHLDYDLVESTNPAFAKAIVRVNVFKNHRQVSKLCMKTMFSGSS